MKLKLALLVMLAGFVLANYEQRAEAAPATAFCLGDGQSCTDNGCAELLNGNCELAIGLCRPDGNCPCQCTG